LHAADIQDADGPWGLLNRMKPLHLWLWAVFADSVYNRLAALLACFLFRLTVTVLRSPIAFTRCIGLQKR
jgi:putative transposase